MNRPKYPVVMVIWLDPSAEYSEVSDDSIVYPTLIHSYGELSYEDDYIINVTAEHFPKENSGRDKTVILKPNIIKIYELDIRGVYLERTNKLRGLLEKMGGNY